MPTMNTRRITSIKRKHLLTGRIIEEHFLLGGEQWTHVVTDDLLNHRQCDEINDDISTPSKVPRYNALCIYHP